MHQYENDLSTQKETKIKSSRIQKKNEYSGRKKSNSSKTCKRKKEIISIGRSFVAYFSPCKYPIRKVRFQMVFSESLKKNHDFQNVYKNGKSYANKYLVMYVLENNTNRNRLGISASKKVGNSVVRHRFARLVRESYRLHENIFNSGLEIVVVARKSASSVGYAEIEGALLHLLKLHHVIKIYFYDEEN